MMHKEKTVFIATLFVLILMNGLCILELQRFRDNYLMDVAVQQENYLRVMQSAIISERDVTNALIHQFDVIYPTSNSTFGIIIKDGEILYYRNEQEVGNLSSVYMEENYIILDTFSNNSKHVQLLNGINYIVSSHEIKSGDNSYIYAIMSSDDGALTRSQSQSIFRHLFLFMGLSSIVLVIIVYQLVRSLGNKDKELMAWGKQEKLNQTALENLSSDLRTVQKTRIEETVFGLLAKEDFLDLIIKLNTKQIEQCYVVKIVLQRDIDTSKIYAAAILQRMEILKCISCEWEKETFMILVLNTDLMQLEHLLRYFLETYSKEYHGNIEDFKIHTQKLRSGENGLPTI